MLNIYEAIAQEPDMEWLFVDGSYVRAHQQRSGAAAEDDEAIAKSRGGNTTKIHLSVGACGYSVAFEITGGNIHDSTAAPQLLAQTLDAESVIADRGYDSEALREQIVEQGGHPVIPRKKHSRKGNGDLDRGLCKLRHLVENAFARLKYFRGVATRYDRLKQNFISAVALVCIFIWLPM